MSINANDGRSLAGFQMHVDHDVPKPKDSAFEYDDEAIQTRFQYARGLKGRSNITPRQLTFAGKYEAATSNALQVRRDSRASAQRLVNAYREVWELDTWADKNPSALWIPSELAAHLMQHVRKLKETEFYCRYGEYLKQQPKGAKGVTKEHQQSPSDDIAQLQAYWKELQQKIVKERSNNGPEPVTMALRSVAEAMDIDSHRLLRSCETYAEGKRAEFKSALDELFAQGAMAKIACTLYHDLKELTSLFPEADEDDPQRTQDMQAFKGMITAWKDVFFTVSAMGEEDQPESWKPTAAAKKLRQKARGGQNIREALWETVVTRKKELEKTLQDVQAAWADFQLEKTRSSESNHNQVHYDDDDDDDDDSDESEGFTGQNPRFHNLTARTRGYVERLLTGNLAATERRLKELDFVEGY
ncbi:uncharacterized protein Z520_06267 [Fonsecaea multimorphosa CBS 102226]|uniref:Uncharacterized protein n=1 Tax=Fonsecaea multimorphosa CBS 102226 TaxID=1442371 RepID=A0A0D2JX95_9EURO|nr:uncharacterized protein Z520_06267 [Fonsecaea multimorphosa CBS 102226]KIX98187.1 hypothetical protein Z520_06267 [Fonsecaea multimorphosa CBS 102226]OAL24262.1 hypothetical protein AYO22_05922 [Fonsecaea multimorphosa]